MPVIIAVVLVILIVVVATWIRNLVSRSRTAKLRELAQTLGLQFTEEGDLTLLHRSGAFLLFALGDTRSMRNLMQGKIDDIDVAAFDFRYSVTLSERYMEDWRQTVVRLASPSLDLPAFSLLLDEVHDTITDNLKDPMMQERLLGMASLRFDGHSDFNARYRLQGMDRTGLEALFDDDMLQYFEKLGDASVEDVSVEDVSVEGDGSDLIFYTFHELLSPDEIETFVREALRGLHIFEEADI
jgi:hypothetical protein